MKIYFDPQVFLLQQYGGISKYFKNLIKVFFDNPDLNVEPVFSSSPKDNLFLVDLLLNTDLTHPFKNRSKLKIIKMINNKNLPSFDLMHFTYYLPSRFIYHKTFKSVSTIHDFTPETLYSKFDLNRYMHYAKLSYIKHSSGLIFVSNHTRNLVSKIYPSIILPKNKVIHHGVSPQSNVKTSTVDNEVPFFFYVGNRNGYKNFNQLLLAFAKFSKKHLVFLLCFGGGQFTKEENVLISRLNLNSFVKHVGSDEKDLEKYFGSALAFINPSVEEGFGMTNLEALSCGTAVLCSDISIFREILSDKSYYFNPQNTESIYLQMLRIFQNPLSDHKKRELVNFSNKYNWITAARKTSSFYESLLNQKILN